MSDRSDLDLAQLLAMVADHLDRLSYPYAGIVHQGARRLALARPELEAGEGSCPVCGSELVQPATGRRRKFCSDRCRKRHERV